MLGHSGGEDPGGRFPPQVGRLAVVGLVLATAFIGARTVLRPATFGERGHYRSAALTAVTSLETHFAGREECEPCHAPIVDRKSASYHRGLACEVCHGAQAAHVASPIENTPPHPPESCSACHGEIARTKAVSYHAQLPCTRCHEADRRHVTSPRGFRPTRPAARDFCGQCHAQGATSAPEIPRIDLGTHYPRDMCWQCHYPHHPEAN